MNDSSQHSPYTITLSDFTATETLTISAGSDNSWINMNTQIPALTTDQIQAIDLSSITLSGIDLNGPTPTYTYNAPIEGAQLNDLITIQPLDTSQWASLNTAQIGALGTGTDYTKIMWPQQQEFVDTWPAWYRMQDMAKKYPAIKKALENLSTVYTMVKDDYDNPTPKR